MNQSTQPQTSTQLKNHSSTCTDLTDQETFLSPSKTNPMGNTCSTGSGNISPIPPELRRSNESNKDSSLSSRYSSSTLSSSANSENERRKRLEAIETRLKEQANRGIPKNKRQQ